MHDPAPDDDVLGANAKHQLMHVIMKSSQQWEWDAMQPMAYAASSLSRDSHACMMAY